MQSIVATVLVALVALAHAWFLVLEMFLWEKPLGLKTFRNTAEKAALTAVLAKNQGLYNGFLVAGLLWGISRVYSGDEDGQAIETFFLGCVVVAGAYGAATVSRSIFFVQAVPELVALAAVWLT